MAGCGDGDAVEGELDSWFGSRGDWEDGESVVDHVLGGGCCCCLCDDVVVEVVAGNMDEEVAKESEVVKLCVRVGDAAR